MQPGLEKGYNLKAMRLLACSLILVLGACSSFGNKKDKEDEAELKTLDSGKQVERYTILSSRTEIKVDDSLQPIHIELSQPAHNLSWPQRGANGTNALGAVAVGNMKKQDSATIGKGKEWRTMLVTTPVITDGVVYAMDAYGYVSAHNANNIDDVRWISKVIAGESSDELLGGGLAVAGEQLFVTTGEGNVYALSAKDGSLIWKQPIGSPIRSAPKLQLGVVYILTVDNQAFALDAASGNINWQHRGINEGVGFLSPTSPAIGDSFVVVGYSSGELYGLAADTGQELWSDSLALTQKTSATSVFTGFDGDPVIAGGAVFASSNNGLSAATHLLTGRRLWEQEITAADTPWLAGNFLFMLTTDAQLVAVHAADGRVKWVQNLPRYEDEDEKEGILRWHGPVLANDQLLVTGEHGVIYALSPQDGKEVAKYDIPDGVRHSPVIADKALYLISNDATLHVLR